MADEKLTEQDMEDILKAEEKRFRKFEETRKALAESQRALKEQQQELNDALEAMGDAYENIEKREKVLEEIAQARAQIVADQMEQNRNTIAQRQLEIEVLEDYGVVQQDLVDKKKDAIKESQRHQRTLREEHKEFRKGIDLKKESAKADRDLAASGKKWGEGILGVDGKTKKLMETIGKSEGGIKSWKAGFKSAFSKQNLKISAATKLTEAFIYLTKKSFELNMAVDQNAAAFMQATGAGREYTSALYRLNVQALDGGLTNDKLAASMTALYQGFSGFTQVAPQVADNLKLVTGYAGNLGVSMSDSAKIQDASMKSLGFSGQQLEDQFLKVISVAKQTRQDYGKVASDFVLVANKLAFYGDQINDVFMRLEQQSKATGLSMQSLLGVAEQFDTFEGSAKAVGRLNAILGGPYLNSLDMVHMDEEQRLQTIKDTIKAAGVQFDQLGKYEQKNIAAALQTDVDTARRLLGNLRADEKLRVMTMEDLKNASFEAQPVLMKLKLALLKLVKVSEPMVDKFAAMVDVFADFTAEGTVLGGILRFLTHPISLLIGLIGSLYLQFKLLFKNAGRLGGALTRTAASMRLLGRSLKNTPFASAGARMDKMSKSLYRTGRSIKNLAKPSNWKWVQSITNALGTLKNFVRSSAAWTDIKDLFRGGKAFFQNSPFKRMADAVKSIGKPSNWKWIQAVKNFDLGKKIGDALKPLTRLADFFKGLPNQIKTIKWPSWLSKAGLMQGAGSAWKVTKGFLKRFAPVALVLAAIEGVVGWWKDLYAIFAGNNDLSWLQKIGAIFSTAFFRIIEICRLFVASFVDFFDMIIAAFDWVRSKVAKIPGIGRIFGSEKRYVSNSVIGDATGMSGEAVRDAHAEMISQAAPNLARAGVGEGAFSAYGTRQQDYEKKSMGGIIGKAMLSRFGSMMGRGIMGAPSLVEVGENGPELLNMATTAGAHVTPAGQTSELTTAVRDLIAVFQSYAGQPTQVAPSEPTVVQIGNHKFVEILRDALDSPAGQRQFGPRVG